jgi:hypothetical protein
LAHSFAPGREVNVLFRRRQAVRLALVGLVTTASIVVATIWCSVSEALRAERRLHAILLVIDLVQEHVAGCKGEWPRSWEDLERLAPRQRSMFKWPDDRKEVERCVSIDFEADRDQLARQAADEFVAIKPRGACYPYKEHVGYLLDTVRRERKWTGQPGEGREKGAE